MPKKSRTPDSTLPGVPTDWRVDAYREWLRRQLDAEGTEEGDNARLLGLERRSGRPHPPGTVLFRRRVEDWARRAAASSN